MTPFDIGDEVSCTVDSSLVKGVVRKRIEGPTGVYSYIVRCIVNGEPWLYEFEHGELEAVI